MKFTKQVDFEVYEVTCKPGQAFTVWLDKKPLENKKEPFNHKKDAVQVELRVTPGLKLEIFCDADIKIKPFSEWRGL